MQKLISAFSLFLCGIWLTACQLSQPVLTTDATTFDFGEVVNGEIATHDFVIWNEGEATLVIESVITTCGCTTATLEPMRILAGETGILQVAFDSGAHGPNLTGEILRQIIIASNDPHQPEVVMEITANVIAQISD